MDDEIESLVVDLGCLLPRRHTRVAQYARTIGVDPDLLVALLTGSGAEAASQRLAELAETGRVNPDAPLTFTKAMGQRHVANRGGSDWPEVMEAISAAFAAMFDRSWDGRQYQRFLYDTGGVDLDLRRSQAIVRLARRLPVVVLATVPLTFAAATASLLQLPQPMQMSCHVGAAPPDPDSWRAALTDNGLADTWPHALVTVADPESSALLLRSGNGVGEVWLLDEVSEPFWLQRLERLTST